MAHHIYIPDVSSARYKVLLAAHKDGGSITLDRAAEVLRAEHQRSVVRGALAANDERGLMNRVLDVYHVAGYIRDHFDKVSAPVVEKYVGEIVGPKYAAPFKPLKALPTAIHADKIRDVSFKTVTGNLHTLGYRA